MRSMLPALFLVLASEPALARDLPVTIADRNGTSTACLFSDFDQKRLVFTFSHGKEKRQLLLRQLATLLLHPADSAGVAEPSGSYDRLVLDDGQPIDAVFRRMDKDEVRLVLTNGDEITLPLERIRSIGFNRRILDVDRREFGKGFNLLNMDVEIALANGFASDITGESSVLEDSLVNGYMTELGGRLAAVSKRPELPYRFVIVNSRVVNAFTVGGGHVFVNRGLIEQMTTEAELAGVLAHEIGHNVGKHAAKHLSQSVLLQGLVSAGGELLGGGDKERRNAFKELGGVLAYFTTLKFSRDDEREADFLGLYNLYQAGYDPRAMVSAFEVLKRSQEHEPSRFEVFFQTHPSLDERIENTGIEFTKLPPAPALGNSPAFEAMKAHLLALPWPVLKAQLLSQDIAVPAFSHLPIPLKIDLTQLKDCALKGRLVASGGSGNDIRVLLFDSTNFLNWKNGHKARAMYDSGELTAVDLDIRFPASGEFYLVMDNQFSLFTPKTVATELFLEYRE